MRKPKITVERDGSYAVVKKDGVTEFIVTGGGSMCYVNALVITAPGIAKEVFAARFKYTRGVSKGIAFAKKALEFWNTGTEYHHKRTLLDVSPLAMVDPSVMAMNLEAKAREKARVAA